MVNYLNKMEPVSPELEEFLRQKIRTAEFDKEATLVSPGQKFDKIWFVMNGVCVIYAFNENGGKDLIDLAIGPNLIWMPEYFRKPSLSRHSIEVLISCRVQSFNYEEHASKLNQFKEFVPLQNALFRAYCIACEARFLMMREKSIEKRYRKCEQLYPEMQKIAAYVIADFLNTTPETLSRQKKKR